MAASSVLSSTSNFSEPVTDSLKGRVALVTGGSRGIGKAIALELARNGATVTFTYNSNLAKAEEVAAEIRTMGVECLMAQGDVASKEDARRVVSSTLEQFKRIDILVNNAGITRDHTLRKMTDEEWESAISVNLHGTYYCTTAAIAGDDRAEIRAHHQHCFHRRPNWEHSARPITPPAKAESSRSPSA